MSTLIVCPACDLAHRAAVTPVSGATRCSRCRAPLQRPDNGKIDNAIALTISALMLFFLTNAYPLVEIHANGATRSATLVDAAVALYRQGHPSLALLVFLTTFMGPFLQIISLLYVLIPLRYGRQARWQNAVFRVLTQIRMWTFVEVFMLGALVALVRLSAFARVVPGIALWSCGLLMLTLAALASRTSPGQFWRWVERIRT
jgi:paraquat-inducible protein A